MTFTANSANFTLEDMGIYLNVLGRHGTGIFAGHAALLVTQANGTVTQATPTLAGLKAMLNSAIATGNPITELRFTYHGGPELMELDNGEFITSTATQVLGSDSSDLTPLLKAAMAPNGTIILNGCHTGSNDAFFGIGGGDQSIACLMSEALPNVLVQGGKRFLARIGKNSTAGTMRTFKNGVEQ